MYISGDVRGNQASSSFVGALLAEVITQRGPYNSEPRICYTPVLYSPCLCALHCLALSSSISIMNFDNQISLVSNVSLKAQSELKTDVRKFSLNYPADTC
jgi:hypothetical protein